MNYEGRRVETGYREKKSRIRKKRKEKKRIQEERK